ncbi:MAG: TonB-dependent receptor [Vicinamibacteria bacterium]
MTSIRLRSLFACAVLLVFAMPLLAQDPATASLAGLVTDPAGAAVANARIGVVSARTGSSREAVSGTRGGYLFTSLPPGTYAVTVEAAGFAPRRFEAVTLEVGRRFTLDLALAVGERQEAVTVEAEAPAIAATSSVVDDVISAAQMENLPLNGRNFLELAFLVPGNAPVANFDPTKTNSVPVSSAGQLGRGGNITIDGQDNNDDVVGGPLANLPQDAVQEFQIATNRFSAEQGRSAASAINVVTKSGSDVLGGNVSFFLRDDALQGAPQTFDDRDDAEAPPFDRQQYAAALGGPLAKGKAWWFGAVEYRNQDAVAQVGARDRSARRIVRGFAPAPLRDFLGTARVDVQASPNDALAFRYAFEDADDTGASTLDRAIGSASQRQTSQNRYHLALGSWTRTLSPTAVNTLRLSVSDYDNQIDPVTPGRQLTFPSLQDGSSFRVPQGTTQRRFQLTDALSLVRGRHALKFGTELSRTNGAFFLGVFREGRVELVQDFPEFDLNRDGRVDDEDLLFAVTLRSGKPGQDLLLDDCDSTYMAFFAQDDWRVTPRLTLNLGLRYELDTDVKNVSGYGDINPIVRPFLSGDRGRDLDNVGPRIGFAWTSPAGSLQVHGGYGIYYDRVTLELISLERGLDGRALPIEVRAGNALFLDPSTGAVPPGAPSFSNPFSGFILPGAGASGINILDNGLENPTVQQWNLGTQVALPGAATLKVDLVHNLGTHFIIGRTVGEVFNPVVGGPDRVVNIESSVNTKYDAVLATLEKRLGTGQQLRLSYTLSRARNYANDDQIPFSSGPIDPDDLSKDYGPTPNEQRHRLVLSGSFLLPGGLRLSPLWTVASGVPMDVLMPDASSRVPTLARNAGGREFQTGADLNAFIRAQNAAGGIDGVPLPLVSEDARFSDSFNSLDLRLSRAFALSGRASLTAIVECFNVLDVTNVLGVSKSNYSGYANVLVRDSDDPADPGFLRSSSFGRPLTTAGGVFGSGGPRALQLGLRFAF